MLKQHIEFTPARDDRHADPKKNYGISSMNIRFILTGPAGVVQFVMNTNWHLPHVQKELDERAPEEEFQHLFCHPQGTDLGFHSPIPQYKGQEIIREDCPYLDGKPCYYNGSTLNAEAESVLEALLREGHEGVWQVLDDYYARIFLSSPEEEGGN